MITVAIILTVIILFLLLRLGVAAEYGDDGLIVTALAGPFRIRAYPREEKPGAAEKKALRKARKAEKARGKEKKEKPKKQMPGGLRTYLDMLPPVGNMLGRIRRRLLIKKLTIHYVAAGADASTTALTFGGANAVFGALTPILENTFRIKRREFSAGVDFLGTEQKIYVHAVISLAVWEAFYIVFALLPILTNLLKQKPAAKATNQIPNNANTPEGTVAVERK